MVDDPTPYDPPRCKNCENFEPTFGVWGDCDGVCGVIETWECDDHVRK